MKNQGKTVKNSMWKKIMIIGLIVGPMLSACGKKGSDGPVAQPVGPVIVNPNGFGAPGNLLSNLQFQASYMQGTVSLTGTGGFDVNDPNAIHFYQGPLTVSGNLQVLNSSLCGAPVGAYNLIGQGQIQAGIVRNTTLTATGPVNLQILISSATAYNPQMPMDRNAQGNRFGIQVADLIVNGQPCGQVTSF